MSGGKISSSPWLQQHHHHHPHHPHASSHHHQQQQQQQQQQLQQQTVSHLGDSSTVPSSSSSLRGAGGGGGGGESVGLGLASSTAAAAAAAAALDHSAHNMAGELPLSPEDLSSDVRFFLKTPFPLEPSRVRTSFPFFIFLFFIFVYGLRRLAQCVYCLFWLFLGNRMKRIWRQRMPRASGAPTSNRASKRRLPFTRHADDAKSSCPMRARCTVRNRHFLTDSRQLSQFCGAFETCRCTQIDDKRTVGRAGREIIIICGY